MHDKRGLHITPPDLKGVDPLSAEVFRSFMRALHLHRQMMVKSLTDRGSHFGEMACLRTLRMENGQSQRDIAEALHLSRPRVTTMLQALERDGHVERRTDQVDQRITRVYLTDKGRALEEELASVFGDYVEAAIGKLPAKDRRELGRLLDAMSDNIASTLQGTETCR